MSFTGVNIKTQPGAGSKVNYGFAGVKISIPNLIPVKVVDGRGRGQFNVELTATNGTTFNEFNTQTDATGNALMQLDDVTDIFIKKELVTKKLSYNGEATITFTIDLEYLP